MGALCRVAIEAITADNQRLKDELALENKFSVNPTTAAAKQLIFSLDAQDRVYEALVVEQQALAERLIQKENQLTDEIEAQRAAVGGVNRALEESIRAQRKVVLLDNRVQQAATAKSTAEFEAEQIRSAVNGLRRERKLFDELAGKMEHGLVERAHEAYDTLKKIAEVHSARSRAESMKAQIREQLNREVAQSEAEWNKLTAMIEADRTRRAAEQAQRAAERAERMEALLRRQPGRGPAARRRGQAAREGTGREPESSSGAEGAPLSVAERLEQVSRQLTTAAASIDGESILPV